MGGEALERTPPNSAGRANVSCPSPPPRAVRGSAFYTEPQDPPSPGILLEIARALWAGPWAILAQLGDATPYPVGGVPPDRFMGGPLIPRPMGVTVPTVAPPGFEPRTAWFLESPP